MAPQSIAADAKQRLHYVDLQLLATKVHAGQDIVKNVVYALQHLIDDEDKTAEAMKKGSTSMTHNHFGSSLNDLIDKLDIAKLCADNHTTKEAVRRILDAIVCMSAQPSRNSTPKTTSHSATPSTFGSIVGENVPTSHLGHIEWPLDVSAHARALNQALATAVEKGEHYGDDARILSIPDLTKLVQGASSLAAKMPLQGTNVGTGWTPPIGAAMYGPQGLAPYARTFQQQQSMIFRPRQQAQQAQRLYNIQRAPTRPMPPSAGTLWKPPVAGNRPLLAPHLQVNDHVAQPIVRRLLDAKREAPNVSESQSTSGTADLEQDERTVIRARSATPKLSSSKKRAMSHTPGSSPQKKKTTLRHSMYNTSGGSIKTTKAPKTNLPKGWRRAYIIWCMAARPELRKMIPDKSNRFGEYSSLLAGVWNDMSEEEKAPYEAMAKGDRDRFARELAHVQKGNEYDEGPCNDFTETLRQKAAANLPPLVLPSQILRGSDNLHIGSAPATPSTTTTTMSSHSSHSSHSAKPTTALLAPGTPTNLTTPATNKTQATASSPAKKPLGERSPNVQRNTPRSVDVVGKKASGKQATIPSATAKDATVSNVADVGSTTDQNHDNKENMGPKDNDEAINNAKSSSSNGNPLELKSPRGKALATPTKRNKGAFSRLSGKAQAYWKDVPHLDEITDNTAVYKAGDTGKGGVGIPKSPKSKPSINSSKTRTRTLAADTDTSSKLSDAPDDDEFVDIEDCLQTTPAKATSGKDVVDLDLTDD